MSVSPLLTYVALCLLPAVTLAAIERAARLWSGQTPWRSTRAAAPTSSVVRARRPVERLADDLGRLRDELLRLRGSRGYARRHHMTAVAQAYDDVLRDCCRALDIPVPHGDLDDVERLRLEAELEAAGLRW
jgi:hypothetical protein